MFWILVITVLFIIIIIGTTMIVAMYRQAFENNVLQHRVIIDNLTKDFHGYRIFFISDIHRRDIEDEVIQCIPDTPDLVIIGGDLAEEGVPFTRIEKNLKQLAKLGPLYFVWGNHDLFLDEERFRDLLERYHVRILENETIQLSRGSSGLNLSGVHDATNELDDLSETWSNVKPGSIILVSHNPQIKNKLIDSFQPELVLSGHTHGGQVRLFGWGIRERGGIKRLPFGQLLISNGYGTTRWPIRWGAKPDALFIILETGEPSK